MTRIACLFAITFLLASQPAVSRSEFRLGGDDGNPWEVVLSGGGRYLNFDGENQITGRVQVGATPNGDPLVKLAEFNGSSMRPLYVTPDFNLAQVDILEGNQLSLPLTSGRVNGDSNCFSASTARFEISAMFDGNLATASLFEPERIYPPAMMFDFSGDLPIRRIRFFPRLSLRDDGDLIRSLAAPSPDTTAFPPDSFSSNVLSGWEIQVGPDGLPFVESPCSLVLPGMRVLRRDDDDMAQLAEKAENQDPVFDLVFPTQYMRYLSFVPAPRDVWEIAQFEVFGEGFAREMMYRTPVLDFGRRVNWSKIRWSGDFPAGTVAEIRTRTGSTSEPILYYDVDVNGTPFRIDREEYESLNPFLQQPTRFDTDNWSPWTPPYEIESGRRDSSLAPEVWEDASRMISFGSSRYLQLQVKLFSRFDDAPRLDQIAIRFSEHPAAQEIVGEISPREVDSFRKSTFTYVISPTFERDDTGFDRLEILTHTRADTVRSVRIDDADIDLNQFPPRIEDDRILVAFPFRQAHPDSSLKRVEVSFDVEVLRFGTQFTGWIYDSSDPDPVKQRVRPGNASFRFSSNGLSVLAPIGGNLLADLTVGPNPFTPNGDGVNDRTVVSYKLREVTAAREVSLEIYDLAGRLVFRGLADPSTFGERQLTWNGRTHAGDLVAPGTYVYRLMLDVEAPEVHLGVVAVAY